jgi:Ca-activated chloride channel family protein
MSIEFARWWPLLGLVAIPFIWRLSQHSTMGSSPRHRSVAAGLRIAVVVLLVSALLEPVWHRSGRWMSVVFALDVSSSIDPTFVGTAIDWIASANARGDPAHSAFLAFGGSARTVASAEGIRSVEVSPDGANRSINQSVTNLEAAMTRAFRSFDPRYLKRLVLITDGNETAGNVSRLLGEAQENGVRVFTLPATVRGEGDSWVEAIDLPEEIREQEPVTATVRVFSRVATTATVALVSNDQTLETRHVSLEPGLNEVDFDVRLPAGGAGTLSGQLQSDGDPLGQNDLHTQSVSVGNRPRILYVEGRLASARYLRDALVSEGMDVTVVGPESIPGTAAPLEEFDLVLLSDVPMDALTDNNVEAILEYVRDYGGGFIFAAGESSYGEEGYAGSGIEEVLPIWFEINERRKDLALVIVLDKSYSMVGPKLELSKEAAKAALDLLEPTHSFGLITFDDTPYVTVPLQLAVDKPRMNDFISRIIAGSQTNIYPALETAFEALAESEAEVRHVILLSDGKTYADDYEELVSLMSDSEITVSSVAVGQEADRELLANIANWGRGRSYFIEDAERVPRIFIQETQIASQSTLVEETVETMVTTSIEAFTDIDLDAAPPLRGYVRTLAKETAEVLIQSDTENPLLARWRYGLGRTAAFTSDVKNRWAVDWVTWDGYGKFWSQLVRETMMRDGGDELDFRVERVGDEALITVSALTEEGAYRSDLDPRLRVFGAEGEEVPLSFQQIGPGTFQARHSLGPPGEEPYRFELSGNGIEDRSQSLFYRYGDEYRLYPANTALLNEIGAQTGGGFLPEVEEIFDDYGETASVPTPLWPWLSALALFAFFIDIAVRRAPWFWRRLAGASLGSA